MFPEIDLDLRRRFDHAHRSVVKFLYPLNTLKSWTADRPFAVHSFTIVRLFEKKKNKNPAKWRPRPQRWRVTGDVTGPRGKSVYKLLPIAALLSPSVLFVCTRVYYYYYYYYIGVSGVKRFVLITSHCLSSARARPSAVSSAQSPEDFNWPYVLQSRRAFFAGLRTDGTWHYSGTYHIPVEHILVFVPVQLQCRSPRIIQSACCRRRILEALKHPLPPYLTVSHAEKK